MGNKRRDTPAEALKVAQYAFSTKGFLEGLMKLSYGIDVIRLNSTFKYPI